MADFEYVIMNCKGLMFWLSCTGSNNYICGEIYIELCCTIILSSFVQCGMVHSKVLLENHDGIVLRTVNLPAGGISLCTI